MLKRFHKGYIPVLLLAQAVGLSFWWNWFDRTVFNQGTWLDFFLKLVFLGALLGLWQYALVLGGKRYGQWDSETLAKQDTLAGLPLIGLALLPLLTPWVAHGTAVFPMKLISYLWLPWWPKSRLLGSQAYTALMLGGLLILSTFILKTAVILKALYDHNVKSLTSTKLFVVGSLILVGLLSWPAITALPNQGEIEQLLVTQSLSFDTAFHTDGVLGRADYYSFYPSQNIEFNGYNDGLSRLFLPVAPGMPLLFITFFLIGGRWLTSVLVMMFAAGAAAQLFGLCRDLGYEAKTAFWAWLFSLITAPLLLYGYQIMEVTASVFFLTWGLRLALKVRDSNRSESTAAAAGLGFISGLIWLGGVRFIVPSLILLGLLAYNLWRAKRLGELVVTAVTMFIPAFFAVKFFTSVYSIFVFHPVYHFNWPWMAGFWTNLIAMVADRGAGVLWYGPVWLLGLAGTIVLTTERGKRLPAVMVLALVSALMIFGLIMPDPRGQGSSFNRLLGSVLPLTAIGLAEIITHVQQDQWLAKLLKAVGGWSVAVAVLFTILPPLAREAVRAKLAAVWHLNVLYNLLPDFGGHLSVIQWLTGLIFFLIAIFGIYLTVERLRKQDKQRLTPAVNV